MTEAKKELLRSQPSYPRRQAPTRILQRICKARIKDTTPPSACLRTLLVAFAEPPIPCSPHPPPRVGEGGPSVSNPPRSTSAGKPSYAHLPPGTQRQGSSRTSFRGVRTTGDISQVAVRPHQWRGLGTRAITAVGFERVALAREGAGRATRCAGALRRWQRPRPVGIGRLARAIGARPLQKAMAEGRRPKAWA